MPSFLSPEWFDAVDRLVANAGDLKIPEAMRAAEINLTITSARGAVCAHVKGTASSIAAIAMARPPRSAPLSSAGALARTVFVEADTAAGIQAFVGGQLVATGDLKPLVALQMEEPSAEQKALAKRISAITQ